MDIKKVQKIENHLKNFSDDDTSEEKIRLLNELVWEKALLEPKQSMEISRRNLVVSENNNYKHRMAECYRTISYCYLMMTGIEDSLKNANLANELYEETKDIQGKATVIDILSHIYLQIGNLGKSIEYSFENLNLSKKIGDRKAEAWSLHNLGGIYFEMGDYEKSMDYYEKSEKIFKDISYATGIGRIMSLLGVLHHKMGNREKALEFHYECLDYSKEPISIAVSLNEIGLIYAEKKEYKKALVHYKKSLKISKEISQVDRQATLMLYMGKLYLSCNKLDKCECFLKEGLSLILETGNKLTTYKIYRELSNLYEIKEDYKNSLKYFRLFYKLRETVFNEESNSKLKNLEINFAIERSEKEAEINRLKYVELDKERKKSESLLHNILPEKIATELKEKGKSLPVYYHSASVLFTDFVGFTQIAESMTPVSLVNELDYCFSMFDSIIKKNKLEKLKTIGDAYMCVGGVPEQNFTHPIDAILAALEIQNFMEALKKQKEEADTPYWELRIGIHTGSLVAGVVGKMKFAYDVWGDTVNLSSRMESSGEKGKINISDSTYAFVKDFFQCEYRGKINAKNKGELDMYFVKDIHTELKEEDGTPAIEFWDRYRKLVEKAL